MSEHTEKNLGVRLPPQLTIVVNGDFYGLAGFEEFDLWMRRNDPFYACVLENARQIGMGEADTLRYLLAAMATKATHAQAEHSKCIEKAGFPALSFIVENEKR